MKVHVCTLAQICFVAKLTDAVIAKPEKYNYYAYFNVSKVTQ